MDKKDVLQYMPMMKGRISYTNDEFKGTNIKNHGNNKGTVRWNFKMIATTMIITGTIFAVSYGRVQAFKTMSSAPKQEPLVGAQEQVVVQPVKEEVVRTIVDYQVKTGDTLDGIIYKYTDSASEKDHYKREVEYYNNIENGMIYAGQDLTLVGVPEEYAAELNTAYNPEITNDDEISVNLNAAVEDMVDDLTRDGGEIIANSLARTIMDELEVYNMTTNEKTREFLAKRIWLQLDGVSKDESISISSNEKSR